MKIQVKICGLSNYEDAACAADCGADYLGFVLHPASPRGIDASRMQSILDKLSTPTKSVAVFVNVHPHDVVAIFKDSGLYAAQIHGDECGHDFSECAVRLWRAVKVTQDGCSPDPSEWDAERYVVDTPTPGVYGGSGESPDWNLAHIFSAKYATMLAGGLTPRNVGVAVREVTPLGVDVSSGVELEPGRKDHAMVRRFIDNARLAAEELG